MIRGAAALAWLLHRIW